MPDQMAELLLELSVEEIPSAHQQMLADALGENICTQLQTANIKVVDDALTCHATARRLVVAINDLPEQTEAIKIEHKGPRKDAPQQAIDGFLKANNITLEDCEIRQLAGAKNKVNETYFWLKQLPPRSLAEILPDMIQQAIIKLPHPKSMRFTQGDFKFIRPLRAIMAYFNGQALKARFDYQGLLIDYTDHAVGNYMTKPNSKIMPKYFADYQQQLAQNDVVLSQQARLAVITDALAGQKLNHALINEVAGLCEMPVPLIGNFDKKFLDLPDFLLESVLNHHQKHFLLRDDANKPTGEFLFFSNGERVDNEVVIKGNQRVLQARLSDALFFVEQDLKQPVTERIAMLENLTFHPKLGSMKRRVEHIKNICLDTLERHLYLKHIDTEMTKKACDLCKSDLTSLTVREFPALQGKMAGYYAEQTEAHKTEAHKKMFSAISQHYLPLNDGDALPDSDLGKLLSLIDKTDILCGFFAINELPTGSKDPFAIRRTAIAIVNLSLIGIYHYNSSSTYFPTFIKLALQEWEKDLNIKLDVENITDDINRFIVDRLIAKMKKEGKRHDIVKAILNNNTYKDKPPEYIHFLIAKVNFLQSFCEGDAGVDLLKAVKRVNNIISDEEKKQRKTLTADVDVNPKLFQKTDYENNLYRSIENLIYSPETVGDTGIFRDQLMYISKMSSAINDFFDNIMVNVEDPKIRENRINLLLMFRNELRKIADFSLIQQ
ncbi:MAG: glycine--tRNA ligase subunit beta [Alphaproteobacteria bacterium]|nr:glycine--tRNA ligase subunit beta [Alphaproteobacteria bacterium]